MFGLFPRLWSSSTPIQVDTREVGHNHVLLPNLECSVPVGSPVGPGLTHPPLIVIFLEDEERVCQPLGVVHFPDEPCIEELFDFFTDGLALVAVEATESLFDRLGAGLYI